MTGGGGGGQRCRWGGGRGERYALWFCDPLTRSITLAPEVSNLTLPQNSPPVRPFSCRLDSKSTPSITIAIGGLSLAPSMIGEAPRSLIVYLSSSILHGEIRRGSDLLFSILQSHQSVGEDFFKLVRVPTLFRGNRPRR